MFQGSIKNELILIALLPQNIREYFSKTNDIERYTLMSKSKDNTEVQVILGCALKRKCTSDYVCLEYDEPGNGLTFIVWA